VLIFDQLTRLVEILSVAFELAEYSLQHQLANFAEVCLYYYLVVNPTAPQLSSSL
jgi:hypothetical protein